MLSSCMVEDLIADVPFAGSLGHMDGTEEITMAEVFLASDSTATITEHTLNINSGLLML